MTRHKILGVDRPPQKDDTPEHKFVTIS